MSHWIDTHAHLAEKEFTEDIDAVIERAKANDVKTILLIGCGLEGARKALELAKRDPMFDVAVGFHPEEVLTVRESDWAEMELMMEDPRVVAIGEIGLDFYWDKNPHHHELQEALFLRQIELANLLHKPIIVHSRDASQKTYDLMKALPSTKGGILHCFSGSPEMANAFIKLGYHISLAGPVTFKNAHVPKEVAKTIDLDHLLIETDSPYLSPQPYRGTRNESAYVVETAKVIAGLRGLEPENLKEILFRNYHRLFEKD